MQALLQIFVSGLTLGAMYALGSVGLALTYGTMRMFNMAHGLFMAIGAYAAYSVADVLGLHPVLTLAGGILAGGAAGALLHMTVVRYMLDKGRFEINIIVATAGVAILLQDILLKIFGAYPFRQPMQIEGTASFFGVVVPYQSIAIIVVAVALIGGLAWVLTQSRFGLAIRATAMNRDAAKLMGVNVTTTYLQVLVIAGALAGAAGILISSISTLSPDMGTNPAIRAFVICVVAGLGSVGGAGVTALALGLIEAAVQYYIGARFGLPMMLALVVLVLIHRPTGLFGRQEVVRS